MSTAPVHFFILFSLFYNNLTDVNECSSSPCLHQGTCTDKEDGFNCTCTPEWKVRNLKLYMVVGSINCENITLHWIQMADLLRWLMAI